MGRRRAVLSQQLAQGVGVNVIVISRPEPPALQGLAVVIATKSGSVVPAATET